MTIGAVGCLFNDSIPNIAFVLCYNESFCISIFSHFRFAKVEQAGIAPLFSQPIILILGHHSFLSQTIKLVLGRKAAAILRSIYIAQSTQTQ